MLTRTALCQQASQIWIDLQQPTDDDIQQIKELYNLDALYIQDVLQPEHLPKWEYDDERDLYFLLGRYADNEASKTADTIHTITRKLAVFTRPGLLITIHRGAAPFLEELRHKAQYENGKFCTVEHMFCRIIKEIFASYEQIIAQNNRELEFFETKVLQTQHVAPVLRGLFLARRRITVIRKVLLLSRSLPDALRQLTLSPTQVQDTRDMVLRIETLSDDLYERSGTLISMHIALADQRANQVMKVLTLFSAFFLPLTFIAGVYGMNFDNMPELHQPNGYFIVLGGMAAVSIFVLVWFKKARWL